MDLRSYSIDNPPPNDWINDINNQTWSITLDIWDQPSALEHHYNTYVIDGSGNIHGMTSNDPRVHVLFVFADMCWQLKILHVWDTWKDLWYQSITSNLMAVGDT